MLLTLSVTLGLAERLFMDECSDRAYQLQASMYVLLVCSRYPAGVHADG